MSQGGAFGPVLVGLRGAGKSRLAPLVARKLQMEWQDADTEMENVTGVNISEIFFREGEAGFRKREAILLVRLLEQPRVVLATGGGAVLHPEVREILKTRATFWLDVPLEVLAKRIRQSSRPRLLPVPVEEEVRLLSEQRMPLYQEVAFRRLKVARPNQSTIVAQVVAGYREWQQRIEGG